MEAHYVILTILDFDELGADGVREVIENTHYPNRCISPDIVSIQTADIGEWSDDHPLNNSRTAPTELMRLFPLTADAEQMRAELARLRHDVNLWRDAAVYAGADVESIEREKQRGDTYRARALGNMQQSRRWRVLCREASATIDAAEVVVAQQMERAEANKQRLAAAERDRDAARAELAALRAACEAVLHQLEQGEAASGDRRDIKWCAHTLRAALLPGASVTVTGVADAPIPDDVRAEFDGLLPGAGQERG